MSAQDLSDEIAVVEIGDDPRFADDMRDIAGVLERKAADVVLNFTDVTIVNSANISQLLRLRKQLLQLERRLILCEVNSQVWGVFLVTGLDKVFEFADDHAIALACLRLGGRQRPG